MSTQRCSKKYVLISALILFTLVFSPQITKSATMDVDLFSVRAIIREDYVLECKETFEFSYNFYAPNDIVFTWPYESDDIVFHSVTKRMAIGGERVDVSYTLQETALNHSSGRETGVNMTLTGLTLVQDTKYTIEMTYLIYNQVKKTNKQNFYDKILGREKNNLKVTFWTHTWPLGAVSGETPKREVLIGTQKQMRPKICEYADTGGDIEWDIRAEYFATTGHAALFDSDAMTSSYLDDHDSFGVNVYYGKTEKTWLFYGYITIVVVALIFVMFKVLRRAKKKTDRSGFFEDEEVDV